MSPLPHSAVTLPQKVFEMWPPMIFIILPVYRTAEFFFITAVSIQANAIPNHGPYLPLQSFISLYQFGRLLGLCTT